MRLTQQRRKACHKRAEELKRQIDVWLGKQRFYTEQPDSELRTQRLAFISEQIHRTKRSVNKIMI